MSTRTVLALTLFASAAFNSNLEAEPIRHSFFVAGPTFTGIIDEAGKPVWDSGKAGARDGVVLANGQPFGSTANPLVVEQLLNERLSRIVIVPVCVGGFAELDQGGGHHEKLTCGVHIHVGGLPQNGQILIRNAGDGNVGDVHLSPANEEQQQVQRPFKGLQLDAVVVLARGGCCGWHGLNPPRQ